MSSAVRVFAPASVSNVACGFDTLGFALERLGDVVTARRTDAPGILIEKIDGDAGVLPMEPCRNTAGKAAAAVLRKSGCDDGVSLTIEKRMPLSSGIGSSAASAVAATVAVAEVLELSLSQQDLLECALEGEEVASGSRHADNVAPALLGGLVLVRSLDPRPDVISLPTPDWLTCALVRPELGVDTKAARESLGTTVALQQAVQQWANLGAFVAALYRQDAELLARSLEDRIAEPVRKAAVPGFDAARRAAKTAGALGMSLSGSGPALFALCRDQPGTTVCAEQVAQAMAAALLEVAGTAAKAAAFRLGNAGARLLPAKLPEEDRCDS